MAAVLLVAGLPCTAAALSSTRDARPFLLHWGAEIPARDGVRLHATVYRPPDGKKYPAIFVVTPYGADRWEGWAKYFAANGYVFVSVDARGRGNSGGLFEPWVNEGEDGADIVQWLARQDFSDGRVAGWGGSYSGKNQWAFAPLSGPALKTIVPAAAGYVGYDMGMLRSIPFPGMLRWLTYVSGRLPNTNLNGDNEYWVGAYAELSKGLIAYRDFDALAGNPSQIWKQWVSHPEPDAFWAKGTPAPSVLNSITMPVLTLTGTYDDAQLGTLRYWREHQGKSGPKRDSYLVIGPWDHPGTREPRDRLGGLQFGPESVLDVKRLHLEWYDWIFKNSNRPSFLRNNFVYYVAGSERWASAATIEAATASRQRLYLSSPDTDAAAIGRRGALELVPRRQRPDRYVDDPSAGGRNEGPEGGSATSPNFLTDERLMKRLNGDGLIYDSRPLPGPLDLVGQPRADLFISMDVPDADVRVQLYEVRRDGSVIFLAQDQIRARYRRGTRPELMTKGQVERFRFDQFPFVARTLQAGSVIRLVICPLGASIHQQRNRHSGKPVADETRSDNRAATIRLHLGPGLSRVDVPHGAAGTVEGHREQAEQREGSGL